MDKTNSAFEFNKNVSVLQIDASSTDEESFLSEEPATSKEWESWRLKKSLVESEMKQKLAQHCEKYHDAMDNISMMIHQLNCLQEETQQSFQNIRQLLDAAYNGELLKLQKEKENLEKELEK